MRTRIFVSGLLLIAMTVGPALPAQAHAGYVIIGGPAGQYLYYDDGYTGGHAGYVGVPTSDPIRVGSSPVSDGFSSVQNADPVPHSITHCTADCDKAQPSGAGGKFDVQIAPASSASLAPLDELVQAGQLSGTVTFFCTVHPWMRGEVLIY